MNLIARALAGLPLAPVERAVLRLGEGLVAAGLVAAAPIVSQALADPTHINYGGTVQAAVGAASTAILLALLKYVSAKGDPAPAPAPAAAPGETGVPLTNAPASPPAPSASGTPADVTVGPVVSNPQGAVF